MKSGGSLSIWFFIGVSLAVNGAVILARGIYELAYPPSIRSYSTTSTPMFGGARCCWCLGCFSVYVFSDANGRAWQQRSLN